ncbi:MAG: hypothetical protein WCJ29_06220 [bacterium]
MKLTSAQIVAFSVTAVVLVTAGIGAYMAGSPSKVRAVTIDNRRVQDLQQIANAMEDYYRVEKKIPDSLETLKMTRNVYVSSIVDQETQKLYEYTVKDKLKYELCAAFTLSNLPDSGNPKTGATPYYNSYYYGNYGNDFWNHEAGRTCFDLEVHPEPAQPGALPVPVPPLK